MKKATRQTTRAHNKRLVLRTIYQEAGGNPSILLSIAAGSGNLIGVDRANSQLRGGDLYLCANYIDHQAITFSDDNRSSALERVMELIDALLIDCKGSVLGIGTGFILRAYEVGDHQIKRLVEKAGHFLGLGASPYQRTNSRDFEVEKRHPLFDELQFALQSS